MPRAQDERVNTINAQVVQGTDGPVNDAEAIGAEANIKEGKGTIYDQAEYFRFNPGISEEMAQSRGIAGRGFRIGRFADDNTYTAFDTRKISPEHAEAISQGAPGNDPAQAAGVAYSIKHPPRPGAGS